MKPAKHRDEIDNTREGLSKSTDRTFPSYVLQDGDGVEDFRHTPLDESLCENEGSLAKRFTR